MHGTSERLRLTLLAASALTALAGPALAQSAQPAGDSAVEEVVVTGSRIASGFQTPTPVTVASAADLKAAAPANLADGLNQLPTFSGSTRTTQGAANVSAGSNGQNLLSLRGLGPTRTLVLLDGRRLVGTNQNGSSDVNILPQNLVSRVDVVTGGASAAYGSDAVAGVVNFVLDTGFQGVKTAVQGGVSTYGDSQSFDASMALGQHFADDRARVILSAQYVRQNGLGILDDTHRDWWENASGQIPNTVAGAKPSVIRIANIRSSVGSYGGLISSGPLKGIQFLPGGATAPFNYGTVTGTTFQSGGDGGDPSNAISPDQRRYNIFGHAEFDMGSHATLYLEGLHSDSHTRSDATITPQVGAGGQFTVFRENAYLPASVAQQMTALNLASIPLGRYNKEFGPVVIDWRTKVDRASFGVKGDVFANWKYDLSYTYGHSNQWGGQRNLPNLRKLYASADAVVNPANGQIVCRSTLSGLDPGCVPMNLFGDGSISSQAAQYILGDSVKTLDLRQKVASFNLSGDLGEKLQLGAGPIQLAAGLEYRKETADQTSDPTSQARLDLTGVRGAPSSLANRLGVWQFNNPQPLSGGFDVKEGYAEVGVPIVKDLPFARAVDFNGALRRTDYSQSGGVTTWKYGVNWQVVDDLRLRLTRSQDIRGPNVLELFNAQTQTNQNALYKGATTQVTVIQSGNPTLQPEVARTLTYGGVYRPSWLPGFQASVDYYKIRIRDAIGSLGFQTIIDQCAAGNQLFCSQVTVNTNGTLIVRSQGLNLNLVQTAGYDFEAAYVRPVMDGQLTLRVLGNHLTSSYLTAPGAAPLPDLKSPGSWPWRFNASARYSRDAWSVFVQERFLSKALIDPTKVEGVDVSLNRIPAQWYTDLTLTHKFSAWGKDQEAFFTVSNLFNKDPPVSGGNPTTYSVPVNFAYDVMGRYFSVGLRMALR
jgi:iron complex outermembrane receptor protein